MVKIPPENPINKASQGLQMAHIAVIETNPPSIDAVRTPTSSFPLNFLFKEYEYKIAHIPAPVDAFNVFTAARVASFHFPNTKSV